MQTRGRRLLPAVITVPFLIWNFIAWVISEPQEFGDTYRYFGSTIFDIQNPGVTPVLFYTTLENPEVVTFLQVAIFCVAFLLLAGVVAARMNWRPLGLTLAALLLVVSMTTPIWSWNMLLASESLAISSAVLWLAALIWLMHRRRTLGLVLAVLASANLIVDRPQITPIVIVVSGIVAIWFWKIHHRALPALLSFIAVLPFAGWAFARLYLLSSDATFRYRYAIDNLMDKTPSFRAHALENIGVCTPLTDAINGPKPWDDVWVLKDNLASVCPEAFLWLQGANTSFTHWFFEIPTATLKNFLEISTSLRNSPYSAARAMPDWLSTMLMPDISTWLLTAIYLIVGIVFAIGIGRRFTFTLFNVISTIAILGTVLVTAFTIWGADGIEHDRHLLPLTLLLPIAALLLPATLSDTAKTPVEPLPEMASV
jgi:hypothetical protein